MAQSFISKDDEIAQIRERLAALEYDKARFRARLHELCALDSKNDVAPDPVTEAPEIVTQDSAAVGKVALFRSLFRGREAVFPRRWSNCRAT